MCLRSRFLNKVLHAEFRSHCRALLSTRKGGAAMALQAALSKGEGCLGAERR